MPTTLKALVYLTAVCAILIGSMLYQEQPAAEQREAHDPQTQHWVMESMVELEQKARAEAGSERRRAEYEACARDIGADYSDDPVQAYGWVRTLCHY